MSDAPEVPLFPLSTVLFPDGPLPLRIFESRYLDMISRCLRESLPFGVVLIASGQEAGTASFVDLGTSADIVDWYQGSDGLLGVTARGRRRFRITRRRVADDGLNFGVVTYLPDAEPVALPADCVYLADILKGVLDDFGRLYPADERRYDDADWVACRLAEILPIAPEEKQRCLEADDALARLEIVRGLVRVVRAD
ncbi:MAG: LON peptidase substrate-binding domain-containing protein [Pseudomonadota bacterium]